MMPSIVIRKRGSIMSGKFMKVKRIIIPTITLVLIASQLMGCAAASQDELLSMIDAGDSIEIEVAAPAFAEAEQGEESSLLWEQLALLSTNPAMRKAWDSTLGITNTDTGKNGMLYVGVDGKNENNNTLRVALHNREFQKALENDSTVKKLAESAMENYTDLDTDEESKALLMGINGYFNILPDNIPSYCNADSTVTRAEFMSAIMRAETAVSDEYEAPKSFSDSVGASEYNDYAYVLEESSYLKTSNKSLNNQTYNGSISRSEAVYMVVNRYFSEDLQDVDVTKVTFEDAKDGGDIATVQGYTGKDYSTNYEIVYSIQNPDKGLPTNLYKALAVAKEKGLIGNDTRWDEAITRSEVIELLVSAYEKETGISDFNAKQGTVIVKEVSEIEAEMQEESTDSTESISVDATGVDGKLEEGEIDIHEEEETQAVQPSSEQVTNTSDYTDEELKALAEKAMQDIAEKNGWTESSDSQSSQPIDSSKYTPSSGELPPSTWDEELDIPEYLQGDHILH